MMRLGWAMLLVPAMALAGVDGVIMNGTSGKPQANAVVTLLKLSRGMENAGTVKSGPDGKFSFNVPDDPQAPWLIQAMHAGVNYSKMVAPGTSTHGVSVDVFDLSADTSAVKLAQHVIFMQPGDAGLMVQELYVFENKGKSTLNDPNRGTLRFFLPPGAKGEVRVSVEGVQGMALQREAQKTAETNVYMVNSAVKPGVTRFNVQYVVPEQSAFATRSLYKHPTDLVVPPGVSLEGAGLEKLGVHPETQASLYRLAGPAIQVALSGSPQPMPGATAQGSSPSEEESGGIEVKRPFLYARLPWILGLAGAMLVLGMILLYRKEPARR